MRLADWVEVECRSVYGAGRVLPRLVLNLRADPLSDQSEVQLITLEADLLLSHELLGRGQAVSGTGRVYKNGQVTVEVPVNREALEYIATRQRGGDLDLTLRLRGVLRGSREPNEEQVDVRFGAGSTENLLIQVPRSDWVTKVLEPIGTTHYVVSVIEIPKESSSRPGWEAAVARLHDAEHHYGLGDDPGVFLQCRGVLDALPGAKQDIFAQIPDPQKRTDLDKLVLEAGTYFHRGRHVAKDGDQQGDFPVDRRDAWFALGLAKLILAYASAVVPPT